MIPVLIGWLQACTPVPREVTVVDGLPETYPVYQGVTIPGNIAPLNFLLRDEGVDALSVVVKGENDSLLLRTRGRKVQFPLKAWKRLLEREKGNSLTVTVTARSAGRWLQYPAWTWQVAEEPLDAYVSYRLIEPGYEVWNALQLRERCVENFDERVLADNSRLNNSCMNCHIHAGNRGDVSLFHLRGKKGGSILNRDGKLRKLNLKNGRMPVAAMYGEIHPAGRYGVFSSNIVVPGFHAEGSRRMEVFDTLSDLVVTDFDANRLVFSPLTADSLALETFPAFSADGKWIYFCTAPALTLPDSIRHLRYSLCRIAFDADRGTWGDRVDTLWNATREKGSVCHPKASPDGRYLLYSVADYGTFPIWHRETELQLMDLQTGVVDGLKEVNAECSDTYHSWAANSRWIAFASKRGDGQYGRVYFAYIDRQGKAHRPFVLPQEDPERDDLMLKSYNIPDLSVAPVPFDAEDVVRMQQEVEAEEFKELSSSGEEGSRILNRC